MVNINIEIPDELHKKIKIQCAVEEKTLKDFVTESLEASIKRK